MNQEVWDYRIDGKMYGLARMAIVGILAAVFLILTIDQLRQGPKQHLPLAPEFALLAAVCFVRFAALCVRYFCFKVLIGKKGFYVQTGPFRGTYCEYRDVTDCRTEARVCRHRRGDTQCCYSFIFQTSNGQTQKFQFDAALYAREIDALTERISAEA